MTYSRNPKDRNQKDRLSIQGAVHTEQDGQEKTEQDLQEKTRLARLLSREQQKLVATLMMLLFITVTVGSALGAPPLRENTGTSTDVHAPTDLVMETNAGDRPPRYGAGDEMEANAGDRPPRYGAGDEIKRAANYKDFMWAVYHARREQNIAAVKAVYDALIAEGMQSSVLYTERALLRFNKLQDLRGAEADCRQALMLNPENVQATWVLAQVLLRREFAGTRTPNASLLQSEMFTLLKRVVHLDPDHGDGHQFLGYIASEFGQTALAITSFKALTRIEPYQPQFHEQLAELYEQEGKTRLAIGSYERVATIQPTNVAIRNRLGGLYLREEDYANALTTFQAVLERVESGAGAQAPVRREWDGILLDTHYGIGRTYQAVDDFEKAEFHLTKALALTLERTKRTRNQSERKELQARLTEVRYTLGLVYLRFQHPQKALEVFEELLSVEANHVGALFSSGSAHQTLGNFQQAERFLRSAIVLEPNHANAANALGYLYAEQGVHLEEAAALVQHALKFAPTSGAYLDSLGYIYFKQGKLDEALELLEQASEQLPDTPEILLHLGAAYGEKGWMEKAVQTLERAVQLTPEDSDIGTEVREKLKTLRR